ncbi:glycine betaine/L-proline ABC transporter ATP-binding protein [Suttonella sp. R2A3]|uniref:quaternary amine ABC transporter ATP-binding protein n=1 Tax=Suttonella sp. R2A3 TaxID=2908648 RepID=UPI001F36D442|nr:glycine betaine/L-proline ABC transporter ATP-binding protein [Suttonella sp. R2A3]UJF24429.1 glycine betaine/L-proline ABC transporter ATP-binding protein [Suttonella sp. R2A3]
MSVIEVRHISKIFGANPRQALRLVENGTDKKTLLEDHQHALGLYDINLTIEAGEIFVIMGLSGSGKSTLIRHFNRLIDPTAGQIIINGQDVTAMSTRELIEFRRHTMSMVFQHFGLMPHRSVLDNVAYGRSVRGEDKKSATIEAEKWLALVGLAGFEAQYPKQLSGGQQQRVGLARALATETDILLMDEAFSALDPLIRSQMQEQLLSLQAQLKRTIVFITHDLAEALRIGSRIAILRDGQVEQVGTPEDILLRPANNHIEEFVKDVNRASVLNAQAVMRRPSLYFDDESVDEALAIMRDHSQDWAWVKTGDHWEGLITVALIERARQANPHASLADIAQKPQSVDANRSIEHLLPIAVGNQYPVPVVDDDGQLSGVVRPEEVISLLESASPGIANEKPESI